MQQRRMIILGVILWAFFRSFSAWAGSIPLTVAESAYIAAHPVIRVSNETDYPPLDFAVSGMPRGYSIDVLNLLAERSGLNIEYVNGYTWSELMQLFKDGQLDLMQSISWSPSRKNLGLFSEPFYRFQNMFVTRVDMPEIRKIEDAYGKVVAVGDGWVQHGFLKKHFPAVKPLPLKNLQAMIEATARGDADALIADSFVVNYMTKKLGITNLKATGWFKEYDHGERRALRFMAQNSAPELISILNKALKTVSPSDISYLEQKWLGNYRAQSSKIKLTQAEQGFIRDHPVVTLGAGASFEPLIIQKPDGTVTGHDVELLKHVTQATGLQFRFKVGPWLHVKEEARVHKLDGLIAAVQDNAYAPHYLSSLPYLKSSSFVIVKRGNPVQLHSLDDLKGRRVAVQKGNLLFEKMLRPVSSNVKRVYVDSLYDVIEAVVSNKVDFTILDETAFYLAGQLGMQSMIEDAFSIGEPFNLVFQTRKDWPELRSIMNKGLQGIGIEERISLRRRWLGAGRIKTNETLLLSEENHVYLDRKHNIRVCINPSWMPYDGRGDSGEHVGMASDYMQIFSERIGIPISIYDTQNWHETLEAIKARKCDVIPLAKSIANRESYLDFTTPYVTFPYVVATKTSATFVDGFTVKKDAVFSVVRSQAVVSDLRQYYPQINLIEVPDVAAGLRAVEDGRAFGYIGVAGIIIHSFQNAGLTNIKIAGKLPVGYALGVATRNDEPQLHDIFQMAVDSLTSADHHRIQDKWLAVQVERVTDYTLLWFVLGSSTVIVVLFVYWNRKLRQARQRAEYASFHLDSALTQLETQNKALEELSVTDRLTQIFNRTKLDEVLGAEIERAKRHSQEFAVIIIDVDFFKTINDTYGHKVGDDVLIDIADVLRTAVRATDVCGRWGGEEFLAICLGANRNGALALAEKLRKTVEEHDFNIQSPVTASLGVAAYGGGDTADSLVDRADKALYKAKRNGRNQVQIC